MQLILYILTSSWHALLMALLMGWEIFWALVLGFALSAMIQVVVSKKQMSQLLPDSSARSLTIALGLGAASSSCSYAAVAITRSIIRKGADFVAAMAFQMSATNLVIELGILMIVLLGWQFTVAEFVGGIILVIVVAILFRQFVSSARIQEAKRQANRGLVGKMEEHAAMELSMTTGPFLQRIFSAKGLTAISHYFMMDWLGIWKDIVVGLLIAGALAAWVPDRFWTVFFLNSHPLLAKFWGPIIGPMVAIFSFVCSVGNVPLAAVLWNGGISFGGVIAFIFADLIVLPILHIYYKYYGIKMAAIIFVIYYIAMMLAAFIIELLFDCLGLLPVHSTTPIAKMSLQLNYTAFLNIIFAIILVFLVYRFYQSKDSHANCAH